MSELDKNLIFGGQPQKTKLTSHEERKSLVEKYKTNLNEEISYYDKPSVSTNRDTQPRRERFLDRFTQRQKKIFMILIAAILLLILILILVLVLKGSKSPDNPNPPIPPIFSRNPYILANQTTHEYGLQRYRFVRNDKFTNEQEIPVTADNSYIDNVTMEARLVNYDCLNLRIKGENSDQFELDPSYLESDFDADFQNGLRFNEYGFKVDNHSESEKFEMTLKDISTMRTYLNTSGQGFLMMSHFQQIGFIIDSTEFYGLGERITDFNLNNGTYTLFPYANHNPQYDSGATEGNELQGQHPFLMSKLNNGNYVGLFLFNSNPQSFSIQKFENGTSQVSIITIGGIMDLFFFKGPRYDDVVRQYQRLIGKPKMLPIWAHGIQVRSKEFINKDNLYNVMTELKQYDLNIEMAILPLEAMNKFNNFDFDIDIQQFTKDFPGIKLAYPYTYFVPETDKTKDLVKFLLDNKLAVSVNDAGMEVQLGTQKGFCVDYFHPNASDFIQLIQKNFEINRTAFFFDANTPYLTNAQTFQTFLQATPFSQLPYIPGLKQRGPLGKFTLPSQAQHVLNEHQKEYHFNLHSLYGTQMAYEVAKNLPQDSKSFVVSDSTFPGAGKIGIGHLLPRDKLTYDSLTTDIANILNFNLFGMPYISPNLCGYNTTDDMELCIRSIQLSIVNPLAILNLEKVPNFSVYYSGAFQGLIAQRLQYMMYQRSELYKVQKYGGTLVKSLSALFPNETKFNSTSIAYGEALKVDFVTKQDAKTVTFYFPPGKWFDYDHKQLLFNEKDIKEGFYADIVSHFATVPMFQKYGTIVPIQYETSQKIENLSDLKNIPVRLLIVVDSFDKHSAYGEILLENGDDNEFYEINMERGIITFKQQNNGSIPLDLHKNIEFIQLIDMDRDIKFACALEKDYKTVKKLYAYSSKSFNYQTTYIYSYDRYTPTNDTEFWMDTLAFIFYSENDTAVCSPDLFQLQIVDQPILNNNETFFANLRQNMFYALGSNPSVYDIYLNITLLSDNSLYFFWSRSKLNPYTGIPTQIYDRNFTQFKNIKKSVSLQDILTFNSNPFYIEIHSPGSPDEVLFSTKDQIQFFYQDFNIFNFIQPQSSPQKFFGIQERKGNFYLQDNYMYSLFNNKNNLKDLKQARGRVIQHGRSGTHPVIMSQILSQTNLTAFYSYSPYGIDILFQQNVNQGTPQVTHLNTLTPLEFVFIFNLSPIQTSEALQKHIVLGEFNQVKKPYMPPFKNIYGWYMSINGLKNDKEILEYIDYFNKEKMFPLEGIYMSMNFLNKYDSLTFSNWRFQDYELFLKNLMDRGYTVINIMKSGFNEREFQDKLPVIQRGDLPYPYPQKQQPVTGLDQSGKVYYLDYTNKDAQQIVKDKMTQYLAGSHKYQKGVNLKYNEIFEVYSSEDVEERESRKEENRLIYRIGTSDQMMHTIAYSSIRQMGQDSILHNLNGLIESMVIRNDFNRYSIISDSTTLGLGQLGVGRLIEYYNYTVEDAKLAMQQFQSLSIIGLPVIGYSLTVGDDEVMTKEEETIHSKLLSMIPLVDDRSTTQFRRERLLKYFLIYYTQTQVFKAQNMGTPFIRPLFYDYPEIDQAYSEVDKQYMYGPSIKVSVNELKNQTNCFFPKGYWCQIATQDSNSACQLYKEDGTSELTQQDHVYLRPGSITPISNGNLNISFKELNNLKDLPSQIDLHILPNYLDQSQAKGELLLMGDAQSDQQDDFCMIQFELISDTITFTDISSSYGKSGACTFVKNPLGQIVIYAQADFQYTKVQYVGQDDKVIEEQALVKIQIGNAYMTRSQDLTHAFQDIKKINLLTN